MTLDEAFARYRDSFDEGPPIIGWNGDEELLGKLLEEAIAKGEPLTGADLARAQGQEPPPPDAYT